MYVELFSGNEQTYGEQTLIGVFVTHDRENVFFHVSDRCNGIHN
jgi:hypothetical protein